MNVGVVCEFSGRVRDAFIAAGHEAVSYDLLIFHPPCTDIAVSGALHFAKKIADGRQAAALDFVRWCMGHEQPWALENPVSVISSKIRKPDQIIQPWQFGHPEAKTTCLWLHDLAALEPTAIVDPPNWRCCGQRFPFARGKYGCPSCHGTKTARPCWANQTPSGQNALGPSESRAGDRSRTYEGIAAAMASQWGAQGE